jgi:hypothetical protein
LFFLHFPAFTTYQLRVYRFWLKIDRLTFFCQVEQLIATVKKDRSEMVRVKSRVTGLVSAVHHFARRGACLSLKATGRGNVARRLVHAFNLWKQTGSTGGDSPENSSPIRANSANSALDRSDRELSSINDRSSLALSNEHPLEPTASANALAAAQASAEAFEDQDRQAAAMVQRKAADAAAALAVAEAAAAEASAAQALTEALKACPWQPVEEEGTGDTYWWNRATNDVTWDTPQEVLAIQDEASLSRSRERSSADSSSRAESEANGDGSNSRYDTAEASNAQAVKDDDNDDDERRQRHAALAAAASAASNAADAQAASEAMAARDEDANNEKADMTTRQDRASPVATLPDDGVASEDTNEANDDEDPAAVAAAAAATKVELLAAAEAAKQLALSTLAASKQAAADASSASARAAERAVPALATRVVARHADELRRIVLDCANRESPATCARGLGAWAVARSKILDETEDAEADGASSSAATAAAAKATTGKEDSADREAAAERFRLACTLVVEVLDGELASLREEALVTAALPLTQSKQSKPSLRIGGAQFNAAAGLAAHAQASAAHASKAAASAAAPGNNKVPVEDPLAAYVSRLVAHYCKPASNSAEESGGKKKRTKRGGGAHPRPVNHPVLSSPLVLKSAPDFHPPQAQVLGELGASGRLADGVLTHLLDELIEELKSGTTEAHQGNVNAPANGTSAASSGGSSDLAAGSSEQSGLIGQWRQSILEASAASHSTGESYDFARAEELTHHGVSADNESDDPPTPAAYLDLAL